MIGQYVKAKLIKRNCFVKNDKHTVMALYKDKCIFITPKNKKNENIKVPDEVKTEIFIFFYKINLDKKTNEIKSITLYNNDECVSIHPSDNSGLFENMTNYILSKCE